MDSNIKSNRPVGEYVIMPAGFARDFSAPARVGDRLPE